MSRLAPVFPALLFALTVAIAQAQPGPRPGADMAAAAQAWLQSIGQSQRAAATFPLEHAERENWAYVPQARQGLPLKEMTDEQRQLARNLIAAGLSRRALLQTDAISALEQVLAAMEGSARRDPDLYYFTVFGTPSSRGTWGWRAEGHHLSLNFTVLNGEKVSATPMFFGANPAEVRIPHPQQGRRALAQEEDLGRAFVKSLDPGQLRRAVIASRAPNEITTGNDRQVKPTVPAGLEFAALTPGQQTGLQALVGWYAGRLKDDLAATEMRQIADAGWAEVRFAWAGGFEPGEGHYYRIQGPAFVIEYDNTQNGANHIHTVWRKFEGDFGRDLLREHYRHDHPDAK